MHMQHTNIDSISKCEVQPTTITIFVPALRTPLIPNTTANHTVTDYNPITLLSIKWMGVTLETKCTLNAC